MDTHPLLIELLHALFSTEADAKLITLVEAILWIHADIMRSIEMHQILSKIKARLARSAIMLKGKTQIIEQIFQKK